ncbi:hypothetical protein BDP27DRAFT_1319995 [Rhodocollybia butyracea]|uniref:Uncharacterized protein n=1 Tax=Rhodocollybia butyracea TaxID=206335 RepID=A0A9P5Q0G9_9AGAR|nr:hypothetical protein BDP27DRAFT_1319995 [Rhodocollybia butyracea]
MSSSCQNDLTLAQAQLLILTLCQDDPSIQQHIYAVLSRMAEELSFSRPKPKPRRSDTVLEQKLSQALDTLAFCLSDGNSDSTSYALSITPSATEIYVQLAADPPDALRIGLSRLTLIWSALSDIASDYPRTGPPNVFLGEGKQLAYALLSGHASQISKVALENQVQLDKFLLFLDETFPPIESKLRESLEALRLLSLVSGQLSSAGSDLDEYAQYIALHSKYRNVLEQEVIEQKDALLRLQTEFNRKQSSDSNENSPFFISGFTWAILEPIKRVLTALDILSVSRYRCILEKNFVCVPVVTHEATEQGDLVIQLSQESNVRGFLETALLAEQARLAKLAVMEPDDIPLAHVARDCHEEGQAVISEQVLLLQRAAAQRITSPHSECILLSYHLSRISTPPYPYFGLNKPTCFGCALYFGAYNLNCTVASDQHLSSSTQCRTRTNGCSRVSMCAFPSQIPTSNTAKVIEAEMISGFKQVLGSVLCEKAIRRRQLLRNLKR